MRVNESYLGDGVYASFDGYHIWLRTQRETWHEIALEPCVLTALNDYAQRLREEYARKLTETAEKA